MQVKESGVNLLPTHEENIMQQSARLSGSHELGGGQFSPVQVPVPSAIKSSIAYKELFMIPPFSAKNSLLIRYAPCAARVTAL